LNLLWQLQKHRHLSLVDAPQFAYKIRIRFLFIIFSSLTKLERTKIPFFSFFIFSLCHSSESLSCPYGRLMQTHLWMSRLAVHFIHRWLSLGLKIIILVTQYLTEDVLLKIRLQDPGNKTLNDPQHLICLPGKIVAKVFHRKHTQVSRKSDRLSMVVPKCWSSSTPLA